MRPVAALRGFGDGLGAAAVVPVGDGRVLLAASGDDEENDVVRLWDPVTGEQTGGPLRENSKAGGLVVAMVALPVADGHTLLATAHHDEDDDGHVVYLWDTVTGEQVGGPLPGPEDASNLVAVAAPDGRHLLAVTPYDEDEVWLWDAATAQRAVGPLRAPEDADGPGAMTTVALADGRTLLATAHGHTEGAMLCLWDPATGEPVRTLLCRHEDGGRPSALATVPLPDGGGLLAVSFNDDDHETVRLWDVTTGAPAGGPITGRGLGLVPVPMADGTTLLSIGTGLWDPVSGRRVGDVGTNRVPGVRAAVALPDGRTLLVGQVPGGAVWLWDPTAVEPSTEPEGVSWDGPVAPVPAADGRTLLATRDDTTVRWWDLHTGEAAGRLHTGDTDGLTAMAAASLPDGRTVLLTGHSSGAIRSWDIATGEPVGSLPPGRTGAIRTMVAIASPDGRTLVATGGRSGVILLRDPETCERASDVFNRPERPPLTLAPVPLPDGRTLLASSEATPARGGTRAVRLWDPATGLPVGAPFENHRHVEHLVALTLPDDRTLLAVRDFDGSIRVWDTDSRDLVGELTGGPMAAIVPSGGHPLLAVAGRGAIQLWDPLARRWVGSRLVERRITALAGVGPHLVVGCADGLEVLAVLG